ncbi:hypothetical protein COLO4_37005 [Corchorus olitorius]|uniref:Uncharacterized protein n=1 Tax=Corchorus olitorius TaxID=93759 RepID=A0A1R3G3T5_9ROSI|nr:hypothetical protein COLO4_37005 [Corchorus olitorius]
MLNLTMDAAMVNEKMTKMLMCKLVDYETCMHTNP